MQYIWIVFNLATLARAVYYIDMLGKENNKIVFANRVLDIPKRIKDIYSCEIVDWGTHYFFNRIINRLREMRYAQRFWKIVNHYISTTAEDVVLFVFKDNEAREATCIENAKNTYKKRVHVHLIEEGIGLYCCETKTKQFRSSNLKKLCYKLMHVSTYPQEGHQQGMHPYIEKIYCTHPMVLLSKFKFNSNIVIEKQKDIFNDLEFSKKFLELLELKIKPEHYDFVFLTEPICDFFKNETQHQYLLCVDRILNELSNRGKVLIKKHPRDTYDYSKYECEKICVLPDSLKTIPYEFLNSIFDYPQIISSASSVALSIQGKKPSIYMYNLYNTNYFINANACLDQKYYECANIVLPKNYNEFLNYLE